MKEFSDRLKELREERNISLSTLANAIDTSTIAISRWERELRTPNIEQLKKLAVYFGVTADYLIGLED